MPSKLEIYNRALAMVSADPVGDINEESHERRTCDTFFESCRDRLLEEAHWPFATKLEQLSKLQKDYAGWRYAYAYPGDCASIQFMFHPCIIEYDGGDIRNFEVKYRIYGDDDADTVILTNTENPFLLYTRRAKNTSLYPASFTQALVTLLASEIAIPIIRGREGIEMKSALSGQYEREKNKAIASQANEENMLQFMSELVMLRENEYPRPDHEGY